MSAPPRSDTDPPAPRAWAASPWAWVPTVYFAQGLPYIVVNLVSVPMFKGLGASNEWLGVATSLLSLPWVLKVLWSPALERYGTRRGWLLAAQGLCVALLGGSALAMFSSGPLALAVTAFAVLGFASATHDVAIDGYYLETLDPARQAFFVGIRTTAYKVAWLLGTGGLVVLAGRVGEHTSLAAGWAAALGLAAAALLLLWPYHARVLPRAARDVAAAHGDARPPLARHFLDAFTSYLRQPQSAAIVAFILLFRLGDALMLRMAQPFLMDPRTGGGLGLSTDEVGLLYGTVGTLSSLGGGVLGGLVIARLGLRRAMPPLAVTQSVLILLYAALAVWQPPLWVAGVVNAVEHLAFGLGVSAYGVFLMQTVQAEHKATHYAIATSLMALGWAVPGMASGYLATALGYPLFFVVCFVLSWPGLWLVLRVPYRS